MNILKKIIVASLDKLSYVAIPLEILSQTGKKLSVCTGFIFCKNDKYYLITNWHCFTGKNPETGNPLNGDFILPAKVRISFHKTKKPCISWESYDFDLIDDSSAPEWFVHPKYNRMVDVVALEIKIPKDIFVHAINQQDLDDYSPMIADDVFILGFPYNLKGGGKFPIWKKASIATEPGINYNNKPQILVDTASRKGMSGAPVIFRRDGVHGLVNGQFTMDSMIGEVQDFLGIYSGRYKGDTEFEAQLGVVWKKTVIDEIIAESMVDEI